MELRCCINPDVLRSNVDKHWFFEDEQVRLNGSVFTRRENFDKLLSVIPKAKFNGIHIKVRGFALVVYSATALCHSPFLREGHVKGS